MSLQALLALKMGPTLTIDDPRQLGPADLVALSQSGSCTPWPATMWGHARVFTPNELHGRWCHPGVRVVLAVCWLVATLAGGVEDVLGVSARPEMIGSDAWRVVTVVADVLPGRDRAEMDFVGRAVRQYVLSIRPADDAVTLSVAVAHPQPARPRLPHPGPEALLERAACLAESAAELPPAPRVVDLKRAPATRTDLGEPTTHHLKVTNAVNTGGAPS